MLFAAALFNSFICEQHHSFALRCKPAARPDKEGIRPAIDRSVSISVLRIDGNRRTDFLRTLPYHRQNPYRYYLNNRNLNEFYGNVIHYNRAENATQAARDIPLPQPSGPEFPYFSEKPIPIPPYDPRSIGRMTELLQEILDPAYILLFGSPADGTPHSDVIGYDLLIATHTPPAYDWLAARRYLKMKMPA